MPEVAQWQIAARPALADRLQDPDHVAFGVQVAGRLEPHLRGLAVRGEDQDVRPGPARGRSHPVPGRRRAFRLDQAPGPPVRWIEPMLQSGRDATVGEGRKRIGAAARAEQQHRQGGERRRARTALCLDMGGTAGDGAGSSNSQGQARR